MCVREKNQRKQRKQQHRTPSRDPRNLGIRPPEDLGFLESGNADAWSPIGVATEVRRTAADEEGEQLTLLRDGRRGKAGTAALLTH